MSRTSRPRTRTSRRTVAPDRRSRSLARPPEPCAPRRRSSSSGGRSCRGPGSTRGTRRGWSRASARASTSTCARRARRAARATAAADRHGGSGQRHADDPGAGRATVARLGRRAAGGGHGRPVRPAGPAVRGRLPGRATYCSSPRARRSGAPAAYRRGDPRRPVVVLLYGAPEASQVYPSSLLPDEVEYVVATADGSLGHRGSVLDLVLDYEAWADQSFAAGSSSLLGALARSPWGVAAGWASRPSAGSAAAGDRSPRARPRRGGRRSSRWRPASRSAARRGRASGARSRAPAGVRSASAARGRHSPRTSSPGRRSREGEATGRAREAPKRTPTVRDRATRDPLPTRIVPAPASAPILVRRQHGCPRRAAGLAGGRPRARARAPDAGDRGIGAVRLWRRGRGRGGPRAARRARDARDDAQAACRARRHRGRRMSPRGCWWASGCRTRAWTRSSSGTRDAGRSGTSRSSSTCAARAPRTWRTSRGGSMASPASPGWS